MIRLIRIIFSQGGIILANKIPIALSNKHLHICQEHLEILFGQGYELKKIKDLSQPGQYACDEKVDIVGSKGILKGVRILGPVRPATQIEISISDGFQLGVDAPVRDSGQIDSTPGIKIVGPKGEVELDKGVIVAARHIHMYTDDAKKFGVEDKDIVNVKVGGPRGLIFDNVLVRVNPNFALEMHVDIEEGNAAGVKNGELVELIK